MNAHERAAKLMEEAERLGCDTPTEAMIADAINSAVHQAYLECQLSLEQVGMKKASGVVGRWIKRQHAEAFGS